MCVAVCASSRCDYYAHHRAGYFTSVKMYSKTTSNAECVNNEGRRSWFLSDGMNPLFVTGAEYDGIFAAWDWVKVGNCSPLCVRDQSGLCSGLLLNRRLTPHAPRPCA